MTKDGKHKNEIRHIELIYHQPRMFYCIKLSIFLKKKCELILFNFLHYEVIYKENLFLSITQ